MFATNVYAFTITSDFSESDLKIIFDISRKSAGELQVYLW